MPYEEMQKAGHPVMEHTEKLSDHGARIKELESSDSKQWEAIARIENRLPNWATMVISSLTFTVGVLVGIILELSRRL